LEYKIALSKAQKYCAYQERCHKEIREKLSTWKILPEPADDIIAQLIKDNYLNEERFALTFAGGKFRIKKWGRIKIRLELEKKKISAYCIKQALEAIEEKSYLQTLDQLLKVRAKSIKQLNPIQRSYAIGQYAISRGFEPELVWERV